MTATRSFCLAITLTMAWIHPAAASDTAAADLYAAPAAQEVRERVFAWINGRDGVDPAALKTVKSLWDVPEPAPSSAEVAERVISSFCAVDQAARNLVDACRLNAAPLLPPEAKMLASDDGDEFYRTNIGLYYGQYLTRRRMYEEALSVFKEINPLHVVDPAAYFFNKAVCEHRLLLRDEGLKTIDTLLNHVANVPPRYSTVATLMQYDLKEYRERSLDEISRLMSDVERRLDLGRAGQRVQKVEDNVVAKLDELIQKAEQSSSSSSGSGSQGRQNQSSNPAEDSTIKGDTAPGEVDPKKLKNQGGWGSLDPKEHEKATNLINRNFPSNYRDAVEQYFKKLAGRPAPASRNAP